MTHCLMILFQVIVIDNYEDIYVGSFLNQVTMIKT